MGSGVAVGISTGATAGGGMAGGSVGTWAKAAAIRAWRVALSACMGLSSAGAVWPSWVQLTPARMNIPITRLNAMPNGVRRKRIMVNSSILKPRLTPLPRQRDYWPSGPRCVHHTWQRFGWQGGKGAGRHGTGQIANSPSPRLQLGHKEADPVAPYFFVVVAIPGPLRLWLSIGWPSVGRIEPFVTGISGSIRSD